MPLTRHSFSIKEEPYLTLSDHSPAIEESHVKGARWRRSIGTIAIFKAIYERLYQSMAHAEHDGEYIGHSWVHRLIISPVSWENSGQL